MKATEPKLGESFDDYLRRCDPTSAGFNEKRIWASTGPNKGLWVDPSQVIDLNNAVDTDE